jgi:hypothetical protein
MPIFAQLPPGEQIKRWLSILTVLVIVLDVIAAVSLMVVVNLMNTIVGRYEPLVMASGDIAASVSRVQTGLYQYLAEYREDTVGLQEEIAKLRGTVNGALSLEAASELGTNLKEIDLTLEKYGKAVQLLPKIGTVTNWKEVEELKNVAIGLGGQVETLAAKMKETSYQQITLKAAHSRRVASGAFYLFVGFFVLSLVIIVLLFLWWRDFQDMLFKLFE